MVVLGVAAAFLMTGGGERQGEVMLALDEPGVLHELPAFIADLKSSGARRHYVKLIIRVEVDEADLARIQERQAQIVDAIQARLREYERKDLIGKVGSERLRADLLAIVDQAIAPAKAKAVLFKEFLLD